MIEWIDFSYVDRKSELDH